MRRAHWRGLALALLVGAVFCAVLLHRPARAGGPLDVGGGQPPNFGADGVPFTWRLSPDGGLVSGGEIQYRTDGGSLGVLANATANTRIQGMFQVWEDVPTSNIAFNRAGSLLATGGFADGDVNTAAEFNAVSGSCRESPAPAQNPIVYDADGSLFTALGLPSGVIGFAGACQFASDGVTNRITAANSALNGKFRDGDASNGELSDSAFDGVFIHEFGHLFGLDHSQINVNCLGGGCASFSDDAFGLPTMFPFLIGALEESPGVHPSSTLSLDDRAWVSRLYPDAGFSGSFGAVSGAILFSDGQTHFQGANVIARQVDDPATPAINESRRNAVSCVSGYLFTINTGQSVTGTNTAGSQFGSRNPLNYGRYDIPAPAGSYTVEVETINGAFLAGSRVGPIGDLGFQYPVPAEFFSAPETNNDNPSASVPVLVTNGTTTPGINIILNGTPPRFDQFETSHIIHLPWNEPPPAWVRRETPASRPVSS